MSRPPASLVTRLAALTRPEDRAIREELILGAMGDPASPIREVAVAWAARCLEPSRLVPLVAEDANAIVRNAALAALERQGPYAVAAVERMTTEPDSDVAMFACQVLGAIGGETSTEPLLAALQHPEINVRQAAIEAMGRLKARPAVPALVALLAGDPWLQLAAVLALGQIGDPAAAEPLLALVPGSFVAEPALDALRKLGAPGALPRLVALLRDPAQILLRPALLGAVAASLESAGPSTELAIAADSLHLDHSPGSLWRYLADRLGGDDTEKSASAQPPLPGDDRMGGRGGSTAVRDAGTLVLATGNESLMPLAVRWAATPEGLVWVRRIAERFPAEITPAIPTLLAHTDPDVRSGCVRMLRPTRIGRDRLLTLLLDAEARVRIAAIEALADLNDGQTAAPIAGRLASDVASEREAATRALANLPVPAVEAALAPLVAEGAPESSVLAALSVLAGVHVPGLEDRVLQLAATHSEPVRRMGLRAAAKVPGSRAEVLLLRALADRDPSLQVEALELLVGRGGHRVLTTLLALLAVADSLRYHVIRALGRLGAAKAAVALESLFPNAPLHEQLEILAALAHLDVDQCRPFLVECLGHVNLEIRRAAARGLADLAGPSDLELFRGLAADTDWVMRSEAARALGRLGLPEGRAALLDLARDIEPAVSRTARAALAGAT